MNFITRRSRVLAGQKILKFLQIICLANQLKLLDKHAVSIVLELFYVFDIIGTSRYIIRCHRHQHCASKDFFVLEQVRCRQNEKKENGYTERIAVDRMVGFALNAGSLFRGITDTTRTLTL